MKKIIIVMVLLAFLLVGCRGFSRNEEGDVNYRRGTTGLDIRFLDRSPPYVVYEGDSLPITLELFNRGASPINWGRIYITGYDTSIIPRHGIDGSISTLPGPEGHPFEMFDAKTQFNREGGYKIKEFQSGTLNLFGGDKYRVPITVHACYDYETVANVEICMDPEPHRSPTDKACITRNPGMGGGQAAPVAVTNVDLTNMPGEMRMTFTIKNVGDGTLVEPNKMNTHCPTGFSPSDVDVVYLDYVKVGQHDVTYDCSPNGRIKLYNGVGRVSCVAQMTQHTAYKTPLEISLYYGYKTFIRRQVEIRGFN